MNAIDTNVYVYTIDADEPIKQAKAIALLDRLGSTPAETINLWQVAGEYLGQLRRFEAARAKASKQSGRLGGKEASGRPPLAAS